MILKFLKIAALTATLTLAGCFGGSTPEPTRYYTLAVESIQIPASINKRLQVKKFTIEQAYQRTNIVYKESPYDFMFYDLDEWASRPELIFTQIANEYFSKVFKTSNNKGDLELLGHVLALEEIDEGSNQKAHLSMTLTLKKTGGEILWENAFDESIETKDRNPRTAAEAISKLFGKFVEKSFSEIQNAIN